MRGNEGLLGVTDALAANQRADQSLALDASIVWDEKSERRDRDF
jgi:hypothetical protein